MDVPVSSLLISTTMFVITSYSIHYTKLYDGRGTAIVVETGSNTEIGKIAKEVSNTVETPSPLTIRMGKFSKQISFLIIVIAFIVTALLVSKGNDMTTIFLAVIALSVFV